MNLYDKFLKAKEAAIANKSRNIKLLKKEIVELSEIEKRII